MKTPGEGDRGLRWEPAVYEHKAALIGRSPLEVSRSAELLFQALTAEHRVYGAGALVVGIDLYNLEAEACGAQVAGMGPEECPDIATPLFDLDALPAELDVPDVRKAGRFRMMLQAAQRTRDLVGEKVAVRVAASGPVTIAAKLTRPDALVLSLALEDGQARRLLRFTTELAGAWLAEIRRAGLDAMVFDSLAAPPIFSPGLYETEIESLHAGLMKDLATEGQEVRPLIVGGETTAIAGRLARTGANALVCDFPADASAFAAALQGRGRIRVRRNVRPAGLAAAEGEREACARQYVRDLACFEHPVGGTGILPYAFDPAAYLRFREAVERRRSSRR